MVQYVLKYIAHLTNLSTNGLSIFLNFVQLICAEK